jgi:hypothetical protein
MLHREHVGIKVRKCRALRAFASVARVFISSPSSPEGFGARALAVVASCRGR